MYFLVFLKSLRTIISDIRDARLACGLSRYWSKRLCYRTLGSKLVAYCQKNGFTVMPIYYPQFRFLKLATLENFNYRTFAKLFIAPVKGKRNNCVITARSFRIFISRDNFNDSFEVPTAPEDCHFQIENYLCKKVSFITSAQLVRKI